MKVNSIKLSSKRLQISPIKPADLEDFYRICQNKNIAHMSGFKACKSIEDAKIDFDTYLAGENVLGLYMGEVLVGMVNFHEIDFITNMFIPQAYQNDPGLVVGFLLDEPYWSQGLMSEALEEIFSYLKKSSPYTRLYASHFMDNDRSMAILVKFDFEPLVDLSMVDGYGRRREGLFYTKSLI